MENTKPTILVVEDDEVSLGSLVRALEDAGFNTLQAKDGESALQTALASHPNLIISDNIMPGTKGVEFLDQLRKDEWGNRVPFILLTGQYDLEAVNTSLEAGKTDFLVKDDTSLSAIIETVQRRLAE
jgi:CheY-like chemotaxis protein